MVNISKFVFAQYPDGHKHIISNMDLHNDDVLSVSIRSFDDLFLVAQIRAIHPELTHLRVLYMLASRCDRRFSPGEAIDIDIVTNFISSLGFKGISIVRPHSAATLRNLPNAHTEDYTSKLLEMAHKEIGLTHQLVFIAPDKGAKEWVDAMCLRPLLYGEKRRDLATGAVSSVMIMGLEKWKNSHHFVIVDDLCDGGATFTTIAKEIKLTLPHAKVYLVVTHAILSKGTKPFEGLIDRIYCTNSFATFNDPLIKQIDIQ